MKNKFLKAIALSVVLSFSFGLVINNSNQKIEKVEAAQHIDNYEEYQYTGTYYDEINLDGTHGLNGSLRTALTSLIYPAQWYTYGSLGENNLATQLQYADEDPNNSNNMVYLYTRNSVQKNDSISGSGTWNREHVWPQDLSNGCWGKDKAGTDLLHIRPTYETTNGARGNQKYGNANKTGTKTITVDGVSMVYGYSTGSLFEPIDTVKGDVARIIMYIWTAYKNYYSNLPAITNVFQSYDVLLSWHTMDKPDELEGNRNNYVQSSNQRNRNPFVDHPEFAWQIFGDEASESVKNACIEAYPGDGTIASKTLERIAITGEANKKAYYSGDTFDPTGLTVTAYYDDDTSRVIPNSSCAWTPNPLTVGTTSVTCTYSKVSAVYNGIAVTAKPSDENGNVFSVEFVSSEGSNELTADGIYNNYLKNNTLVKSIDSVTKVFQGNNGIKLGSSSYAGSISLTMKEAARSRIEKLEVVSARYSSDSGTLTIKLDSTTVGDNVTPGSSFVKTLNSQSATTITISTSSKRAFLIKIIVTIKEETPVNPPSSSSSRPASSSVAPSSSSIEQSSAAPSSSQNSSSVYSNTSSQSDISSSEMIGSSIIEHSSEATGSSSGSGSESKKSSGCGGSVMAIAPLSAFSALIGLVFVLSKKKKK